MLTLIPLLVAMGSAPAAAEPDDKPPVVQIAWLPDRVEAFVPDIERAARRHDVDPDLVAIVVLVESGGRPRVVSPAGAVGLMQLMPSTAWAEVRRRGLKKHESAKLFEPRYNLDLGVGHLRWLAENYADDELDEHDVALIAAAYNGGAAQAEALAAGQPLRRETARYVDRVQALWRARAKPEP